MHEYAYTTSTHSTVILIQGGALVVVSMAPLVGALAAPVLGRIGDRNHGALRNVMILGSAILVCVSSTLFSACPHLGTSTLAQTASAGTLVLKGGSLAVYQSTFQAFHVTFSHLKLTCYRSGSCQTVLDSHAAPEDSAHAQSYAAMWMAAGVASRGSHDIDPH